MNNNKILTKQQLLQQISLLVDNYVSNVLEKKPEYDFVMNESQVTSQVSQASESVESVVGECVSNDYTTNEFTSNDNEGESVEDNICMAFLTNGKRCSRERCPEGADPEICKFHNNKKFDGRLEKVTRGGPTEKKMKRYKKPDTKNIPNKPIINEEIEEIQEFHLTQDEDGAMIDQNGSIWDLDTETIIGKKDFITKEKIFFKKL